MVLWNSFLFSENSWLVGGANATELVLRNCTKVFDCGGLTQSVSIGYQRCQSLSVYWGTEFEMTAVHSDFERYFILQSVFKTMPCFLYIFFMIRLCMQPKFFFENVTTTSFMALLFAHALFFELLFAPDTWEGGVGLTLSCFRSVSV